MTYVNAFGAQNAAASTSIATASVAVSGGSTLVVFVSTDSSGGPPAFTVADGANTFQQIAGTQDDITNAQCLAVFIADNIAGGTRAITASFASKASRIISVMEFSGRDPLAFDQGPGFRLVATGSAATDGDFSATVTPTVDGEDIAGVIVQTGAPVGNFTAGTGFTLRDTQTPGPKLCTESMTQSVAAALAATFTDTTTGAYIAAIVTLKPLNPVVPIVNLSKAMRPALNFQ